MTYHYTNVNTIGSHFAQWPVYWEYFAEHNDTTAPVLNQIHDSTIMYECNFNCFQILMYANTIYTVLEWVRSVPGHIPEQAVIFENRSPNETMYVVKMTDGSITEGGLYETNKLCAEYLNFIRLGYVEAKCVSTFEFLVYRHCEYLTLITINCVTGLLVNSSPVCI